MNIDAIRSEILESIEVKQRLISSEETMTQIASLADAVLDSIRSGGKVIFAGNGGSFGDAQHLSAEFVSRFKFDRAPIASIALGTNCSAISAIGNDYGYVEVFARELSALGHARDVFIPITTSGNSSNILESITVARKIGIKTVCLTGSCNGKVVSMCDCICVPSESTARIQESHITIGHILCGLVEEACFGK